MSCARCERNRSDPEPGLRGTFSSTIFAPKLTASSTAALSFIKNSLSVAVSFVATEFLRIGAYFANFGSLTT